MIERAFPNAIEPCGDALSGALMNAGPIIHPPLITMNAGPIEHFDKWDIHKEGTQPAIRRVTDALDAERIAIREALGYGGPHFPLADHYSKDGEPWMYARDAHDQLTDSGDWSERLILVEHRYMLEDLRLGLSFLASVADLAGVQTPLVKAFLAIGSAITRTGFRGDGPELASLGLGDLDRAALQNSSHRGFSMKAGRSDASAPAEWAAGLRWCSRSPATRLSSSTSRNGKHRHLSALAAEARAEIRSTLEILSRIDLLPAELVPTIAERITIVPRHEAAAALPRCDVIFEGMPEILGLKQAALAEASRLAGEGPIIASTTSTILVDDLAGSIEHPGRFLNAHWLNPAYLVPLIELSPGRLTAPEVTARMKTLLEGIGKVPVVCAARPGFIVPRIQSLAMNEAARMVEEGVASAEDIDKAVIYGFGFRFAVLGLLEFIDWGGGDILHHASRYLVEALGDSRYAAPDIIATNMREGRIGMKTGQGFMNYEGVDLAAYREKRLAAFAAALRAMGLARKPVA